MNFIDQVLIPCDNRYTIAVTKDHNKGLVVQVARMNPSHVRTDNGAKYVGHEPVVVWQEIVPFGEKNKVTNAIDFKDVAKIQSDLNSVLSKAQTYVAKCIALENGVDTLLKDLDAQVNKK